MIPTPPDAILLQLGPIAVRWYGLMYLLAFGAFWLLGRRRIGHPPAGAAAVIPPCSTEPQTESIWRIVPTSR